jgi:peptidoglycan/xylan/chitin deacetylase (PgdA/CDA1 family)
MFSFFADAFDARREREAYFTLSVDDGHATDLKTAEILSRLGLQATFYVPAHNDERPVMRVPEVVELSRAFEIGGHTMNHRRVHRLSYRDAYAEISDGKKWLEDVLSKEVTSFCYPGGKSNPITRKIVANLGFIGARTSQINLHTAPADPFRWGVSTQAYSHGLLNSLCHNTLAGNMNHLLVSKLAHDWETHFLRILDWVEARGGIAHLYMHSWETDSLGEWDKLERVLANAASRKRLHSVSNGTLFSMWYKWRKQATKCAPDPPIGGVPI